MTIIKINAVHKTWTVQGIVESAAIFQIMAYKQPYMCTRMYLWNATVA